MKKQGTLGQNGKLSRRQFIVGTGSALVGMGLGMGLPGCAPTPMPTAGKTAEIVATKTAPPVVKQVVKLTHWMHLDPPNPVYQQLVDRFNELYKGQIQVEMQVIPWDTFHQQLVTAIAAGSAPDTIRLVVAWIGEFSRAKWLLPLDDYIKKWDGKDNFAQASYDARRGGPGQPVVMMPNISWASLLYYRRDWFEKEGIKVPTTMDAFLDTCKAIARPKENRWGYAVRGSRGGDLLHNWIFYTFGGRWVDDSGNIVIDSPDAVAGAEYLVNLRRKWEVCRPEAVTDNWTDLVKGVQTGAIGMINHGIHIRQLLTDVLHENIAPAKLPVGKAAGGILQPLGPAILSGTKTPDEAFEWAKFWASKEAAEMFLAATAEDMVPENKLVADHAKFKNDPYYQMTAEMQKVPDYTPNWHGRYGSLSEKLWSPTFQQALLGEITPQAMMKTYADYMKQSG